MAFVEAQRPSWDPQPLDVAVKRSPGRPWDSAAPTKPQRPQLPSLRSIFGPLPDTGRGNVGIDSLSIPRPDSSPAGPESSTSSSRLLQQYSAPLPLPSQQYISPVSLPSATEAWRDRLHSHQLSPNERPASKPSPGSKNNLSSITRSTLAFPPPDRQPSSPASSVGSVGEAEQPSPTLSGSARVRYSHDGAVSPSECPTSPTDRPGSHSSNRKQALAITPRCIGQRMIEGQGLCYVYEDGRYCRATIDGKKVNPTWGITKAGKPRRRLAQACLTCREKKIKCEPAYPSCVQCEKGNRSCKR